MKRVFIFIVFLLLIIPIINAGNVYTIDFDDVKEIDSQIIKLGLKDRVDFDLVNGTHTVILSDMNFVGNITKNNIDLDVFRYIDRKLEDRMPVGYLSLRKGEQAKLDLNMDKYNDLTIRIIEIKENESTLLFTKLHECVLSDPKLCEKKEEVIEKEEGFLSSILNSIKNINKIGLIILFSIIIIGLSVFFIFRKKSSKP